MLLLVCLFVLLSLYFDWLLVQGPGHTVAMLVMLVGVHLDWLHVPKSREVNTQVAALLKVHKCGRWFWSPALCQEGGEAPWYEQLLRPH